MRKIFTFILLIMTGMAAVAVQPEGVIKKANVAPVINGAIDTVWKHANVYKIDKPYSTEVPTLGKSGETTWQALWDSKGIYVLLKVTDDQWYPNYAVTPAGNDWEYDKPEVYFDVNYVLKDQLGAQHGQGHYQVAPAAESAKVAAGTPTTNATTGVIHAFKVEAPNYVAEYFVPFSYLKDKEGTEVDRSGTIGFDVTIIDRDPGDAARRRAVWANTGAVNESWSNMDDVGLVTLEGVEEKIYIDKIVLTGGSITKDNDTLRIKATITPADATVKTLKWSVVNKTGRATISALGTLTPIMDGVVTVVADAQDGSYEQAKIDVTISGQKVTLDEVNLIKNGLFNQVDASNAPLFWGGWVDGSAYGDTWIVVNGVAVLGSKQAHATENWHYQFNQSGQFTALPNIPYVVSFKAWSDVERPICFDFEDTSGNNYNRYGASATGTGGRSEWTFPITKVPTKYTFNVTFDQMVASTVQKIQFMISQATGTVYLDSVYLVSEDDLKMLKTSVPLTSEPSFIVYPNPVSDYLNVALNSANTIVTIYNGLGVKMDEVMVPGVLHRFDVRSYPKGLYFVKADNAIVKFIK